MVNVAGDVPVDGSVEEPRPLERRLGSGACRRRVEAAACRASVGAGTTSARGCCPHYHEAVELIGQRWTGAIVDVLLQTASRCASREIAQARARALRPPAVRAHEGARGARRSSSAASIAGTPVRVEYALTDEGRQLEPAVAELKAWARRWLDASGRAGVRAGCGTAASI